MDIHHQKDKNALPISINILQLLRGIDLSSIKFSKWTLNQLHIHLHRLHLFPLIAYIFHSILYWDWCFFMHQILIIPYVFLLLTYYIYSIFMFSYIIYNR